MKKLVILILMACNAFAADWKVLPVKSEAEFNDGQVGGPGFQLFMGIARCAGNPDWIYMSHDEGNIWRSTDGGESWQKPKGIGLSLLAGLSINVDPVDPRIVFVVVDAQFSTTPGTRDNYEGIYRSTDAGENWTFLLNYETEGVATASERRYRHDIDYDPTSISGGKAQRWYVAAAAGGSLDLFRSDDGGDTWTGSLGLDDHSADITRMWDLKCHPTNGVTVYFGTNNGLYSSGDRGVTVSAISDLGAVNVSSVEVHPTTPSTIFVAVREDGIYKSTNSGTNFAEIKNYNAQSVFMNKGFPDVMYVTNVAGENRLLARTVDGGDNWDTTNVVIKDSLGDIITNNAGAYVSGNRVGIVPNTESALEAVAICPFNFYKTVDGGDVWDYSGTLFTGYSWATVTGIGFDPSDSTRMMIAYADVGMHLSETEWDWFAESNGTRATGTIASFADATGGQVTVTTDAPHGMSNKQVTTITGTTSYNGDFLITNVSASAFEITDTWVANDATGAWKALNIREMFEAGFLEGFHLYSTAISPDDPDIMIASVGDNDVQTHILRTVDAGDNWAIVVPKVDVLFNQTFLEFSANDGTIVYASTWRSTDSGVTWTDAFDGTEWAIAGNGGRIWGASVSDPSILYGIGKNSQQIMRSPDKGVNWVKVADAVDTNTLDKARFLAVNTSDPNIVYFPGQNEAYEGTELVFGVVKGTWDGDTMTFERLPVLKQLFDTLAPPLTTDLPNFLPGLKSIACDSSDGDIIYVSLGGQRAEFGIAGISLYWKTTDGGATWTDISGNLPYMGVRGIIVSPNGELLTGSYWGTWVYPSDDATNPLYDNGVVYEPLPDVTPPEPIDGLRVRYHLLGGYPLSRTRARY